MPTSNEWTKAGVAVCFLLVFFVGLVVVAVGVGRFASMSDANDHSTGKTVAYLLAGTFILAASYLTAKKIWIRVKG